jgi:hypothetical protein
MVAVLIRAFERCDAEECDEKLKTTLDVTVEKQEWEDAPEEPAYSLQMHYLLLSEH